MSASLAFKLTTIYNKKMVLIAAKYYGASIFLNTILLKTQMINWAEFGVLGAVIGSLFLLISFLVKPMVSMMVEDKKSDNEIKEKLANNVQALSLVLSEHIIKSDAKFEGLKAAFDNRDQKLNSIDESLKNINEGIKQLNSKS